MRKIAKKVLLPMLCVVALLACTFSMFTFTGSANNDSVKSVYDIDSYHNGKQVGWAGDGVVTAWDIIERDGYLEGCWYPWFTHSWLGSSLCESAQMEAIDSWFDADSYLDSGTTTATKDYWQNMNECGIDSLGIDQIKMEIFNLKSLGFNVMAYMGSPWGEGVNFDTNTWDVLNVKQEYLDNMRVLLNACREVGMPVLWYIHCHSSAVPSYSSVDMWYRINQMYSNPEIRQHYADRFVTPVAQVLSEYRDVVVMVGLTDELENEMNDSNYVSDPKFEEGSRHTYGVTQEDALAFQAAIGQAVKSVMPDMPTTFASNKEDYAMTANATLDFVGRNQYSSGTGARDLTDDWATGPYIATEYGHGDGVSSQTEDAWGTTLTGKRDSFLNAGYSGFFHWAYQPTFSYSSAGGNQYLKTAATTPYDFRKGMYEGYYWADAKMAELKPANHTANGPSAMYHYGDTFECSYTYASGKKRTETTELNGKVFWLQPKNTTSYKVERSVNGGSWTQISGTVTIDTDTGSYRYCMTDPSPVTSGTVQYRITANNQTSYTNVWTY